MTSLNDIPTPTSQPRYRWFLLGGWVVFFVVWMLFILGWGQGEVSLLGAATSALFATLAASGMSPIVWRLSGRFSAIESLDFVFFVVHLAAACFFSVTWSFIAPALGILWDGGSLSEMQWGVQVNSWRLFMGVWLYVIIAGISYAVRIYSRLNVQREIASRAEALAAEAKLNAMRSQLQPHFLFNALHSVSSLIETDPEEAVDAMEMLGDLLRYAIRDRESHWVELGEEWQFVSDYVALQKLRFGENVAVELSLSPEAKNVSVPAFILQPLVENAFIHGIASLPNGGSIWIEGRVEGDELVLTVSDDGVGISDSVHSASADQEGGSGLKNLTLRLRSLYASNALLSFSKRKGGGTVVEVRCSVDMP